MSKSSFFMLFSYYINLAIMKIVSFIVGAYDLIVIEDEATPLAAGVGHSNYYIYTLVCVLVLCLALVLVLWTVKRHSLVIRLNELNEKRHVDSKAPFFIKEIKEEISTAESDISATMM